jgi:spermidine synthase
LTFEAPSDADDGLPATLVDSAEIPGGGQLHLVRSGEDFEIVFDDEQLMGSWAYRSEEALATLTFERLGHGSPNVLIGGLGLGFTLAAARNALPLTATVIVAELVPKVVSWANGPLAHIFGDSLADPRVSLEVRDVHDVIIERAARFDAILLDVDNGPDALINLANERLYCNWGLRAAHSALRPGGMLAIWSAYSDPAFSTRLQEAGFSVEEILVDQDDTQQESPHTIWFAAKQR